MKTTDIKKQIGPRTTAYSALFLFLWPVFATWLIATHYFLPRLQVVLERNHVVDIEILQMASVSRVLGQSLVGTVLVLFVVLFVLDIKRVRWVQNRVLLLYLLAFCGNFGVVVGLWSIGAVVLAVVTQ